MPPAFAGADQGGIDRYLPVGKAQGMPLGTQVEQGDFASLRALQRIADASISPPSELHLMSLSLIFKGDDFRVQRLSP